MSPDKDVRGREAESLLRNELLTELLAALDAAYTTAWRNGTSAEQREDAFRYIKVIEHFRTDLEAVALTGSLDRKRKSELETGRRPIF